MDGEDLCIAFLWEVDIGFSIPCRCFSFLIRRLRQAILRDGALTTAARLLKESLGDLGREFLECVHAHLYI